MTLRKAILDYIEDCKTRLSGNSVWSYSARLKRMSRWWAARHLLDTPVSAALKRKHLSDLFRHLIDTGRPKNTLMSYRDTISSMVSYLVERNLMEENKVKEFNPLRLGNLKIRKTKPRIPVTDEEYKRITAYCKSRHPDWYWMIRIAWESGMRIGDICQIHRDMIDMENMCAKFTPQKTRSTGRVIEVPLSKDVAEEIGRRLEAYGDYAFPKIRNRYVKRYRLDTEFKPIAEAVGMDKSFHCFRHAFVTRLITRGVDPLVVMSITGQSAQTMARYLRPAIDVKRKVLGI